MHTYLKDTPSLWRRLRGLARVASGLALSGLVLGSMAQQPQELESGYTAATRQWVDDALALNSATNAMPLRMEVSVGALDSRLRLAPCGRVEPYLPNGSKLWGKSRIGLRCVDGVTRWNVFVPVTVKAFGPAWIVRGPVASGAVLTQEDAMQGEIDWAEDASPIVANAEQWVGAVAARALAPGQAVRFHMVKQPQVFQAGAQVRVVAEGNGFQVASDGQAMQPGVIGQTARVRMENGRVMSGVVLDARTIKLEM
jgi:flagella basal body P-ring formation protein FlgA